MDWTYKYFNHAAVFKAPPESVLAAARASVADALGDIEDTPDGFVARGRLWHNAQATVRITPTPDPAATRVAVALQVERGSGRYYMLVDPGGYYDGQIDKWFAGIAQGLGGEPGQVLVSKTTSSVRVRRGCCAGCLVWVVLGACLSVFAIPLDRALLPQLAGSGPGLFTSLASLVGLAAGVVVLLYVLYPEAPAFKFLRGRK